MRVVVFCATFAAIAFPPVAGAQSLTLTEADALARLSADSPRVRAMRAGIDVARVDLLTAGRWPNPRVTYDRESVAGITEHMAMVAQALPISGRRGFEVEAASTSKPRRPVMGSGCATMAMCSVMPATDSRS